MKVALLAKKTNKQRNKQKSQVLEVVYWGFLLDLIECFVQRSHSWGCGRAEGVRTEDEERVWTKEDLSWLAGRKIPTEESVNSKAVVGVPAGILGDELHKIIEALLWESNPSWQLLRRVHPPGPESMMALGLSQFLWKSSLPTASQENGLQAFKSRLKWFPPWWIAPGTEQAGGSLKNILWAHWLYPYEYLLFFSTKTKVTFLACSLVVHSELPMQGSWLWSLIGKPRSHMPCGQKKEVAFTFMIKYLGILSRFYPLFRKQYC